MIVKNILLYILFLVTSLSFSQDIIDKALNLQYHPRGNNYAVQTIYNKLNNSSIHFQNFLRKEISLSEERAPDFNMSENGTGRIKNTYTNSIISSGTRIDLSAYRVFVEYKVFSYENTLFVKEMEIWGRWESVANIFIKYYPTSLNVENLKDNKSEVTSYYIEDRAVFTSFTKNGKVYGRITVKSNNKNQTIEKFKRTIPLKIEEYKRKQEKEKEEKRLEEERKERERILEEKRKAEEERIKKQKFLEEVQTTTYTISDIDSDIVSDIETSAYMLLGKLINNSNSINTTVSIKLESDLTGKTYLTIKGDDDLEVKDQLKKLSFPPVKYFDTFVKSEETLVFKIVRNQNELKVRKKNGQLFYEGTLSNEVRSEIEKFIGSKDNTNFVFKVKSLNINNIESTEIELLKESKIIDLKKYIITGALGIVAAIYYLGM